MSMIWIDLETFSKAPLKDVGGYRYAFDPSTEILLVAYALDEGQVQVWDCTLDDSRPLDLMAAFAEVERGERLICAHNSMFDRPVLEAKGYRFPLRQWRDSAVKALTLGLPAGLDDLGRTIGLAADQAKLKTGSRLIQRFSVPAPANHKADRYSRETHPAEWQQFIEYARQDVEAMRTIYKMLPDWNYKGAELALWHLDQEINDRGMPVDAALVEAVLDLLPSVRKQLNNELKAITKGIVPAASNVAALTAWVRSRGIHTDALAGADVSELLSRPDLPDDVRRALEIRAEAGKSSTAKYTKMRAAAMQDGTIKGTLQFCGASRTGRWGGRLTQFQNLPRPSVDIDQGCDALLNGTVDLLFDNAMEVASSCIRGAIKAPSGYKLVVSDLAGIEGRVLPWLCRFQRKLDQIAGGLDTYKVAAAGIYGVKYEDVTKDQRFVGKVAELACIAESTPVLTRSGWKPIEQIRSTDEVWDGIEWVTTDGAIYRGEKNVIEYAGLTATPDHIVWTKRKGPVPFGDAARKQEELLPAGPCGVPFWLGDSDVSVAEVDRRKGQERAQGKIPSCTDQVQRVRNGEMDEPEQPCSRANERMSAVHETQADTVLAGQKTDCSKIPVHEQQGQGIRELRSEGDTVPIRFGYGSWSVSSRTVPEHDQRHGAGPDRQQWALRQRESSDDHKENKCFEQTRKQSAEVSTIQGAVPGDTVRGQHPEEPSIERANIPGDSGQMERSELQTKRRVWDILNCGPRNRFCAAGIIVHNCGYQGGVNALQSMAKVYGADIDDDKAKEIVSAWRETNSKIKFFWYGVQEAVLNALDNPATPYTAGRIMFLFDPSRKMLLAKLPSGRALCYFQPIVYDKLMPWGEYARAVSYIGVNQTTRKVEMIETYGGKFVEQCCQAVARDILAANMPLVEQAGFQIIGTVHDEIITLVPEGSDLDHHALSELLATAPEWADGLPLAAEGYTSKRYQK